MYQSAAHTAIEAQAECFGKPLIRRELAGRAVNQALQYSLTEDDEVEDLFLLLKEVKERFPEVEGVGSGAILSNYQRTRVENVCGRLGLTSLAYLWRRPQSPLLAEMVEAGLNAVLVKVASFGLEPSKHLGRSLARLRPFFESLHSRCGFHVCGEGGEYETLTLDCPLFVRKLVLDETVVVNHSDDMFAPVGLLRVVKCHTEPKTPPLTGGSISAADNNTGKDNATGGTALSTAEGSGGLVYLSGVRAAARWPGAGGGAAAAAAAARQAADCLEAARTGLEGIGVCLRDVCFVHLYLRDMRLFSAVNEEYCKWFEGENPPSRSCVSVPLPLGCSVMLDLVALRGSGEALAKEGAACAQRQVLHVRSISSWAPVCIGPYCQANTLGPGGGFALVAGQIGLQAASMTFPARRSGRPPVPCAGGATSKEAISERRPIHEQELSLCVSHASSVASAVGASVSRGCVFATLYVSEEAAAAAAAAAAGGGAAVAAHAKAGAMDRTDEEGAVAGEGRGDTRRTSSSDAGTSAGAAAPAGGSGGCLEGMVDECRVLMEGRLSQEQAEAAAEAAGTEGGEDGDSAEDGWTSDPEELAKEAPRKMVLARRVPILAVVVPSLPRNAAVELELEQAMSLVLAGVSDAVSAARLRWHDVANLRVYYNARRHGPSGVAATGTGGGGGYSGGSDGIEEGFLKRATFLALAGATRERPAVSFVPVNGLGGGAAVSVHATAWSLDRLRTELWVRGAT
ncbi:conserved unknown protein [Ectocarpus siliculosus]|uniref:Diphthine--ammonia ligase n=1 Tax=Ectocarpus siliculosus TaxID=2880 RepID=D8LFY1_ECTSI|nr:conserved unknown protein [Ectocarpus siliculosus]|eukprot:CBN78880.1 conserved unknown protein [Ectocarpus siliculosus]